MALPLTGTVVVDAGGPTTAYCAKLLWDLGAEVKAFEAPGGHELRRRPPFDATAPERSLVFDWYHGGSEVVAVDPSDISQLTAAAAGADVVLVAPGHSPWPSDEEHPGWVPADAITCSITPFGRGGPYADVRATHMVSAAVGGALHRHGPVEGPPVALPAQLHWDIAAAHGALAVVAALRVRPEAGGQTIDVSAQEVDTTLEFWLERWSLLAAPTNPRTIPMGIPPTGVWHCADGVFEVSAHQEHHWPAFLELLGNPDELSEPALADMAIRRELAESLGEIIERLVAPHSRLDLFRRGQALGLPTSIVNTPMEFIADEQLAARAAVVERRVGDRTVRVPASPLRANVRLSRDTPGVDLEPLPARPSHGGPAPLSGVRVLSFGAFYAGNTSAAFLAVLGAEVVKIESPARPEVLRSPSFGDGPPVTEPSGVGVTPAYASLARGARNLALDVRHPDGLEVFRRLVPVADVVVENFGSGVMERLGLGFDDLVSLQPHVVLLSLSGYGRTGPRAGFLAYAGNISNFCGLTTLHAHHTQLSDAVTAVHGAVAAVAALDHARRIGRPVHVDVSQIEAMAAVLAPSLLDPLVNRVDTAPSGNHVPGSVWSGIVRCAGADAWLAVDVSDDDTLARLIALLDRPDLLQHSPLGPDDRAAVAAAVAAWCADASHHAAALLLQRAGIPAGPVQGVEDVARDPQLHYRHFPARLPHPDLGSLDYPGAVHHLSATPPAINAPAARHGSDTRSVLQEWLGLDDVELDKLAGSGAIAMFDGG